MAPYSLDLRQRVLRAWDAGLDAESVAARFEVSRAWVHRLVQRRRETGSIAPRKQTRFRGRALTRDEEVRLGALITADPDATLAELRAALYPPLAAIANEWRTSLGEPGCFPSTLDAFIAQCHATGQTKPTPLLLRYGKGDFNCLHQDLYGPLVFPLQLTILLSSPGDDFNGGEFVLVEQRPRAQSRPVVVPLSQGEAVIFPVHHRPVQGTRGVHRVTMRHGVSRITGGIRQTLGIIFHDAA